MQIVMPNGRTIALQPQTPVDLGRAHYGITLKAPFVARQQCTATLRHDGTVEVISIARHNPTLVLCHTQANAQRVLLKQGERAVLHPGDSICLLCSDLTQQLHIQADTTAWTTDNNNNSNNVEAPPCALVHPKPTPDTTPAKRQRVEQQQPAHSVEQQPPIMVDTSARPTPPRPTPPRPTSAHPTSAQTLPDATHLGPNTTPAAQTPPHDVQRPTSTAVPGTQTAQAGGIASVPATQNPSSAVMLFLIGVPGSGKSTFAQRLVSYHGQHDGQHDGQQDGQHKNDQHNDSNGHRVWVRINQDSLRSKAATTAAAHGALAAGHSVIIDRCNLTPPQRSTFVQMARNFQVPMHAVFLDVPVKTAVARASGRVQHEGGVTGPRAGRVVYMMNKELEGCRGGMQDTVMEEGVQSCLVCTSDQHTRAALHVWEGAPAGSLDGWDPVPLFTAALPEGSQQPQPTRRQITLDAFLHRPTAGGAAGGAGGAGGGNKKTNTSNTSNTTNTTNTNTKNTNKTNNTSKTPAAAVPPLPTTSMPQAGAPPRVSQGPGGWRAGLRNVALAPQQHPDVVLRTTQHSVLMLDGYPKAQRHALVLARDPLLRGPRDLRREHVGVLQDMMAVGRAWAAQQPSHYRFILGFHSAPSMDQLHMHVISTDMQSECVKRKEHWNSFTTAFFLKADAALQQLQTHGHLTINREAAHELLKQSLRCHRCNQVQRNLPVLKQHIVRCTAPLPGDAIVS